MSRLLLAALIIVMVLVVGISVGRRPSDLPGDNSSYDLSFLNYEGEEVTLSEFEGTPLIVNSWAVWCPFCVKELPDFAAVQREFTGRVSFVAINRSESRQDAQNFTDELGISDELIFLIDPNDSFYQSIGGFAMPETLFLKPDGTINLHKRGPMSIEEIRSETLRLLQES